MKTNWKSAAATRSGILPDTTAEQARTHANATREQVVSLAIPRSPAVTRGHMTLSVGVASYDKHRLNTAAGLIEAADKALYAAKRGRTRSGDGRLSHRGMTREDLACRRLQWARRGC